MNKEELIENIAESASLSKADAGRAVDAFVDTVKSELKKGGDIRLVGFGTFHVVDRKASTGRNPRTGETIQIAASKQPKFKAGQPLRKALNNR
ncbi:MAG: HU family DNA-binding protein [Alphaproteobacteria bacterium]|nr:HU family DNA-binding protein [Alphaproteobacteria bacterium]MDA7982528.1 HU family DNA-binding protein [Alphaproteobacteria bacterium]MDA7988167.1 HU family DNA-binding protein [Alphaproteobacteria bacterium]MDA7999961.1 HU family DNA-binding protein [Alphaproteobacteria bacterium]MDA8003403.1 HU family DNA-binding protein [Alphaproteobacteria bacterium]